MRALAVVLVLTSPAAAQNWPSFRGPNAAGIADGYEIPGAWDGVRSVNVAWKTALPGLGHSSPIVWDDRIFLTTAVSADPDTIFVHGLDGRIDRRSDRAEQSFRVFSLSTATGEILWQREAHRAVPRIQRHPKNSYASPLPSRTESASSPTSDRKASMPTISKGTSCGSAIWGPSTRALPTTTPMTGAWGARPPSIAA